MKLFYKLLSKVLGIGSSLWRDVEQNGQDLLQDPVFTDSISGNPNANPTYIGSGGVVEFSALSGQLESGIPVEDGIVNGEQQFNILRGEGRGSIDSHWNLDTFGTELMVFAIDPRANERPLSRMSVRSLEDLGYSVNLDFADDYVLPSESDNRLRGSQQTLDVDTSDWVYLKDDVVLPSGGIIELELINAPDNL